MLYLTHETCSKSALAHRKLCILHYWKLQQGQGIWSKQKRKWAVRMSRESHAGWTDEAERPQQKLKTKRKSKGKRCGHILTGHSVRVHAELTVVDRFLVQTRLQPLHHWGRRRQAEQALRDEEGEERDKGGEKERFIGELQSSACQNHLKAH